MGEYILSGEMPSQHIEQTIEAATPREAASQFLQEHPGIYGVDIDNPDGHYWTIVGRCEACGLAIFDDDDYAVDEEQSVKVHRACPWHTTTPESPLQLPGWAVGMLEAATTRDAWTQQQPIFTKTILRRNANPQALAGFASLLVSHVEILELGQQALSVRLQKAEADVRGLQEIRTRLEQEIAELKNQRQQQRPGCPDCGTPWERLRKTSTPDLAWCPKCRSEGPFWASLFPKDSLLGLLKQAADRQGAVTLRMLEGGSGRVVCDKPGDDIDHVMTKHEMLTDWPAGADPVPRLQAALQPQPKLKDVLRKAASGQVLSDLERQFLQQQEPILLERFEASQQDRA